MEELKRVHLRPLVSGDFIIDGITYKGQHIEKKLDVQSVNLCLMMQFYIDIKLTTGREYRIWYHDMDMSRVSVPMYINKYKVRATYLHALYAIVAEVSYYLSGFSKEINRDYLINTKEISKFYINRDVDIIIKEMLKAAGIDEEGLLDKI